MTTPFDLARESVEAWLSGSGAAYVTRVTTAGASIGAPTWRLTVSHPKFPDGGVRIVLPRDFPASPAQVFVDPALCLVLPHIEETGKVCLGVRASANNYEDPIAAVGEVLHAFTEFIERCRDDEWVAEELQRECWDYWGHYCTTVAKRSSMRRVTQKMVVALSGQTGHFERKAAVFLDGGKSNRPRVVVGCQGEEEAHTLAQRHGLDGGQLLHGRALFVSMPSSQEWKPGSWPREFKELDRVVAKASSEEVCLRSWVHGLSDGITTPSYVVLIRGLFAYAYQLLPPLVPHLTPVTITPVPTVRVDPSWALTRGHDSVKFDERQRKRVLLLGCGSLGAPVAESLARAGVGKLVLVDPDVFLPENCSRHTLGLSAFHANKAIRLANRISREVPGVVVQGAPDSASVWVGDSAKPGMFDLVVDCTGESSVRGMLTRYRHSAFGAVPIIHAWLEPFCAAAHVVLLGADEVWPLNDPADSKVNAAEWPDATKVDLPACSTGFHPYGAADVMQVAGFTAERLLSILDGAVGGSQIWSWVRTTAFFNTLPVVAVPRAVVPIGSNRHDSTMLTRDFSQVLYGCT